MKNHLIRTMSILVLVAPLARADEFPAELELSDRDSLSLTATSFFTHPKVDVKSGPLKIVTEERGLLFGSTFVLKTADGRNIKFSVPKASYVKPKQLPKGESLDVSVPADKTGQNVGLKARIENRTLETWQELERQTCTTTCHGYTCGNHTTVGGKYTYSCGYGSYSCDDKKDVIVSYRMVERKLSGELLADGGAPIGTLKPVPKQVAEVTATRDVSSCGGHASEAARKGVQPHTPVAEAGENASHASAQ